MRATLEENIEVCLLAKNKLFPRHPSQDIALLSSMTFYFGLNPEVFNAKMFQKNAESTIFGPFLVLSAQNWTNENFRRKSSSISF